MAILRSFIFRPESNLPRPDSLPGVPRPDDVFSRDDVILKECRPAHNMGRHLRDCSIPYTKQRALKTGHPPGKRARFGIARLAESHARAKTYGPRSETLSVSRIHGND